MEQHRRQQNLRYLGIFSSSSSLFGSGYAGSITEAMMMQWVAWLRYINQKGLDSVLGPAWHHLAPSRLMKLSFFIVRKLLDSQSELGAGFLDDV